MYKHWCDMALNFTYSVSFVSQYILMTLMMNRRMASQVHINSLNLSLNFKPRFENLKPRFKNFKPRFERKSAH